MRSFIAANPQQMEHLAHLRVQSQALVYGAQQFCLGWLLKAQTDSGGDFLRQRFRQEAQLEHAASRVERKQPFCCGAKIGQ